MPLQTQVGFPIPASPVQSPITAGMDAVGPSQVIQDDDSTFDSFAKERRNISTGNKDRKHFYSAYPPHGPHSQVSAVTRRLVALSIQPGLPNVTPAAPTPIIAPAVFASRASTGNTLSVPTQRDDIPARLQAPAPLASSRQIIPHRVVYPPTVVFKPEAEADSFGSYIHQLKVNKAKKRNYDRRATALFKAASSYCRCIAMSKDPWASPESMVSIADEALELALKSGQEITPFEALTYHDIIVRRSFSQMRGMVKIVARPFVAQAFGFRDCPTQQASNRERYHDLLVDDAYTCKFPDTKRARWCHPVLLHILHSSFFAKSAGDGVKHQEYFNPVTPSSIAFIFTAVRCCLDEYKTGLREPLRFTASLYKHVYDEHMAGLLAMNASHPEFLTDLGKELWVQCINEYRPSHYEKGSARASVNDGQMIQTIKDAEGMRLDTEDEATAWVVV